MVYRLDFICYDSCIMKSVHIPFSREEKKAFIHSFFSFAFFFNLRLSKEERFLQMISFLLSKILFKHVIYHLSSPFTAIIQLKKTFLHFLLPLKMLFIVFLLLWIVRFTLWMMTRLRLNLADIIFLACKTKYALHCYTVYILNFKVE